MTFNQGVCNGSQRKDSLFSKWCLADWIAACLKKVGPHHSLCTKINSKLTKELNVRPETLEMIEKNNEIETKT